MAPVTHSLKHLPINILQLDCFSLPDRFLLAMMMFADSNGVSYLSTGKIAVLIGLVDTLDDVDDDLLQKMRIIRHKLSKRGLITHHKIPTARGGDRDQWQIHLTGLSTGAVDLLNLFSSKSRNPVTYTPAVWPGVPLAPEALVEEIMGEIEEDLTADDLDALLGL